MDWKRTAAAAAVTLLVTLTTGAPGLAHDSWIQTNTAIVPVGQPVYIDLFLGNHSNEHRSYRIAGKLDPAATTLKVYHPNGVVADYSTTVVDYGEPDDTPPAGAKGYLGTSFVPVAEGLYLAVASFEDVLQHGDGPRFRSYRTAKAYFAAVDGLPTEAHQLAGWDTLVAPTGAELVPQFNPVTIQAGQVAQFRLLEKGKPAAGHTVVMVRRSTSEYWEAVSDEQGLVSFPVPAADYYLVRTKIDRQDEAVAGAYDLTSYTATLTFIARR